MTTRGEMTLEQPSADTLKVILAGDWQLGGDVPKADTVVQHLQNSPAVRRLVFDTQKLGRWDTGLLTFLLNLRNYCAGHNINLDSASLPEGARKLLELAAAVPEKKDARKAEERQSFLLMLGNQTVEFIPIRRGIADLHR